MELEITPEPSPEERQAIERALAALHREREESPWWESGRDLDPNPLDPEP